MQKSSSIAKINDFHCLNPAAWLIGFPFKALKICTSVASTIFNLPVSAVLTCVTGHTDFQGPLKGKGKSYIAVPAYGGSLAGAKRCL
eukprot:1157031-Pelagomonas_calceolata.AAC.4